jgi:Mn-dependent DtxR family transcriptional regulator
MALSKTQSKRLGTILSVMFNEDAPSDALQEIEKEGFVEKQDDKYVLTEKGNDERNRLSTLAGLNIKYRSERLREEAKLSERESKTHHKDLQTPPQPPIETA